MFNHKTWVSPCHWKYASTGWIMMMATTCLIFMASWCTEHFPWICSLLILIIIISYFTNKEAEVHQDQAAVSRSVSGTSVIQKQVRSTAEVTLPLLCCLCAKWGDSYTDGKQVSQAIQDSLSLSLSFHVLEWLRQDGRNWTEEKNVSDDHTKTIATYILYF